MTERDECENRLGAVKMISRLENAANIVEVVIEGPDGVSIKAQPLSVISALLPLAVGDHVEYAVDEESRTVELVPRFRIIEASSGA